MISTLTGLLLASTCPQAGDSELAAVLQAERARAAVMDRVRPAVCSIMREGAPGGGSGVVVDPHGFVLTNFHVVGKPDAARMVVGMPDGELYPATVLGIDPGSDLALLLLDGRADGRAWPSVELGDSDALLVGQAVFAMGNPFLLATDFLPTVTWGIVSGTHRYQPGPGNRHLVYPDCIQVDAPVNPGNSGGPLFDMAGRVVGINGRISIRDRGRVNVGVGFAIASNQIRNFLPELMAGRFAEHGTLDLNAWYMSAPDGSGRRGVFVQAIFEDSLAGLLGVRLGDELVRLDDTEIRSANQLATLIGVKPAGAWVALQFRPQTAGAGGGAARTIDFPLNRLDTGSSRQPDRLAAVEHRRLAVRALLARCPESGELPGATVVFRGPDGERVTLRRRGAALRIESAGGVLVRDGEGGGFAIDPAGAVADLTAEQRAKLDRVLATNPWLWGPGDLLRTCADGVLDGGALVFGRPAYRIALAGEGQREIWLSEDGAAAGCRYRDPVRKALIELRMAGDRSRVIVDGEWKPDWRIAPALHDLPEPALFERPDR